MTSGRMKPCSLTKALASLVKELINGVEWGILVKEAVPCGVHSVVVAHTDEHGHHRDEVGAFPYSIRNEDNYLTCPLLE